MNSGLARRWTTMKQLFADALQRAPAARAAFVAQACRGDPALRDELETLLVAHDHPGGLLDSAPISPAEDESAQTSRLASGAQLGPYEIVDLLGEGGMGQVYRARDTRLGREVAIKVLAPGKRGQEALRRFEREARAAGSLNHPNILDVHDVGTHESAPYIVSELLHGTTLRALIVGKPLSLTKALDYAIQFAQGLSAAHDRGVVHRDLKPENLFITREGRLKILDFGIAKLVQQEAGDTSELRQSRPESEAVLDRAVELAREPVRDHQPSTGRGTVLGTVNYMSPEQIGGMSADYRSDIFSAGVILYEMLVGRLPFTGDQVLQPGSAFVFDELPAHVPSELRRIVRRCLQKDPGDRFSNGGDLALALARLSPVAAQQRGVARRRVAVLVLGSSLLVGLGLAAMSGVGFLWRPAERPPSSTTAAAPAAMIEVNEQATGAKQGSTTGEPKKNEPPRTTLNEPAKDQRGRAAELRKQRPQESAKRAANARIAELDSQIEAATDPAQLRRRTEELEDQVRLAQPLRGEPPAAPDPPASYVKASSLAVPPSNAASKTIPEPTPASNAQVDVEIAKKLLAAQEEAFKAEAHGHAAGIDAWRRVASLAGSNPSAAFDVPRFAAAAEARAAQLEEAQRAAAEARAAQLEEAQRAESQALEAAEQVRLLTILLQSGVPFALKAQGLESYCQKHGWDETKRMLDLATAEARTDLEELFCVLGCPGAPDCGIVGLWRGNNAVSELSIAKEGHVRVVLYPGGDVYSGVIERMPEPNPEHRQTIEFTGTNRMTGRRCAFVAGQTATNRVEGELRCLYHRDAWLVHREWSGSGGH